MANVVMADDGIAFDGVMAETAPLGGAETAFLALAEALAARGHRVEVHNRCRTEVIHKNVRWVPLSRDLPNAGDLYIANRSPRLIGLVRRARRRVLWLHNPAFYLKKPRNLWRLAWYRPTLVVTGGYHAMAPLRRARDHPLRHSRSLPDRTTSRAPAAASDLHVKPVARARLAARSLG